MDHQGDCRAAKMMCETCPLDEDRTRWLPCGVSPWLDDWQNRILRKADARMAEIEAEEMLR